MTCPHCSFENMDSRVDCFRCGQPVDLEDVDVDPPRRPPGRREGLPWLRHLARRLEARSDRSRGGPSAAAAMSLVPGLGHWIVLRDPIRAMGMALACLGALTVAAAMDAPATGLTLTWLLAWMTLSHWLPLTTHVWIVTDAYQRTLRRDGLRAEALEMYLVSVAAVAVLCAPGLWGALAELGERATGFQRLVLMRPLPDPRVRQGDVLLVREGRPQGPLPAGTVVRYQSHQEHVRGDLVGTVLASPGDDVRWDSGHHRLLVDGRVADLPPEVRAMLARTPDEALTLASGQLLTFQMQPIQHLSDMLVDTRSVDGVVVRIVDPASRRHEL